MRAKLAVLVSFVTVSIATGAFAQSCNDIARNALAQLGPKMVVGLEGAASVAARQLFTLKWHGHQAPPRVPAYLMVSFDNPVRFEGRGFYVLLPTASAPFGISKFRDQTRVIVPLFGTTAPRSGGIKVRPLQAGVLNLQWAIVGHDRCREVVSAGTNPSLSIQVQAIGAPEIVVNPFIGDAPKERIYSPVGDRVVEVYQGRYRLLDERSGAEIVERAGLRPRFSPSGRYVAAYTGESAARFAEDGLEILDTVDGRLVHRETLADDLAWDNADSFAIINRGAGGSIAIVAPSLADPVILAGRAGCRACGGTESTALRVDLDNNVAVFSGDVGVGATSLTLSDRLVPDANRDVRQARQQVIAFVRRQSPAASFSLPKTWELRGGLKFSNLRAESSHLSAGNDPLLKFLVKPLMSPTHSVRQTPPNAAEVTQWRAMASPATANENRNFLRRLEEFGLPIAEEFKDQSKARFERSIEVVSKDEEGSFADAEKAKARSLVRRIGQEVATAGTFVPQNDNGQLCIPSAAGDNYRTGYQTDKRYERFQRAINFRGPGRLVWVTHFKCKDFSSASNFPSLVLFASNAPPWFLDRETGDPHSTLRTTCFSNIAFCDFDARIAGERFLILSSPQSRAIEIYDLAQRRNLFKKYDLPRGDLLEAVILSPDGALLLQINTDGSFFGYRLRDGRQLFEGRYVDDELVVSTPDGRFAATAEGAHYVSLRLPGRVETHTFEQFSAQLRTPGLIARVLAGETFPEVRLGSPPSLTATIDRVGRQVQGIAHIAGGKTALDALFIYQDGLLTHRIGVTGSSESLKFEFEPVKGARWVNLVATDKAGLASLPIGRDLSVRGERRRVHVLSIGIDEYSDNRIQKLNFARSDAQRFAQAVATIDRNVVVETSRVLDERSANPDAVLAALRGVIEAAEPDDTVLLFFAGHGVRTGDGNYFIAMPNTRIDNIPNSSLPWKDVADVLSTSKGRIAVFLDTCHSGAADTSSFTTNDAAAKSLLERISSGIVVFSASKGREESEENAAVAGGVFTSSLIDVIAGDRARFDVNKNEAIEISELYLGVKRRVTAETDGRQTPWISRNQMVGEFSLF